MLSTGTCLGSHVAVRDSPYLIVHSPCLAGDDGRDRERHHRDQEPANLRRVLQMGWLGASCGRRRVAMSFYDAAVAFENYFTMVLVATSPHSFQWPAAFFLVFLGPSLLGAMEGAPVAVYSWHALETIQRRSECAETGLIGRSPTTSVGTFGIYTHARGREGPSQ